MIHCVLFLIGYAANRSLSKRGLPGQKYTANELFSQAGATRATRVCEALRKRGLDAWDSDVDLLPVDNWPA